MQEKYAKMTDEQFAQAAEAAPGYALEFAAARLTDEQHKAAQEAAQ